MSLLELVEECRSGVAVVKQGILLGLPKPCIIAADIVIAQRPTQENLVRKTTVASQKGTTDAEDTAEPG